MGATGCSFFEGDVRHKLKTFSKFEQAQRFQAFNDSPERTGSNAHLNIRSRVAPYCGTACRYVSISPELRQHREGTGSTFSIRLPVGLVTISFEVGCLKDCVAFFFNLSTQVRGTDPRACPVGVNWRELFVNEFQACIEP